MYLLPLVLSPGIAAPFNVTAKTGSAENPYLGKIGTVSFTK